MDWLLCMPQHEARWTAIAGIVGISAVCITALVVRLPGCHSLLLVLVPLIAGLGGFAIGKLKG